jgi:predicted dehydrogenase
VTPAEARGSDAATRVFAPRDARPAADTVDLSLATAAGTTVTAHLSNAAPDRHGHRWEIDTDGGQLALDDGGIGTFGGFALTLRTADGMRTLAADPKRDGDYRAGPVSDLAARFVAAARDGIPVMPGFDAGARAQALAEAVAARAARFDAAPNGICA